MTPIPVTATFFISLKFMLLPGIRRQVFKHAYHNFVNLSKTSPSGATAFATAIGAAARLMIF